MDQALKAALTTLFMAAALVALAMGNEHLLHVTEVTEGVNWIYLPAGLRLCYVLVMPVQGTLAIFAASLIMASRDPGLPWALVLVSACVTAAGPLLARVFDALADTSPKFGQPHLRHAVFHGGVVRCIQHLAAPSVLRGYRTRSGMVVHVGR